MRITKEHVRNTELFHPSTWLGRSRVGFRNLLSSDGAGWRSGNLQKSSTLDMYFLFFV